MPVRVLTKPYADADILRSLTPLVRDWFLAHFTTFTPPQQFSILNCKKRLHTLISSPTGSGKTLSAFLAVLDELVLYSQEKTLEDKVYCIYVSPLKALGNDIEKNLLTPLAQLQEMTEHPLGIRVGVRTGDTSSHERAKLLKTPPHILITTPESLAIMLTSPKFSQALHSVEWMIIDEVHAIAENKRGTQLSLLMERLHQQTAFTRIGLSATVAPLDRVAQYLVGTQRTCDVVDVTYAKKLDIQVLSPVKNLVTASHQEILKAQYAVIHELVQQHKTTVIFTNTRAATERVVHQLKTRFPSQYSEHIEAITDTSDEIGDVQTTIAAHHGSLSKEHRLKVEQALRKGTLKCAVSSTSLELGIDIGYIDLVILLGSPKSVARALQRIGRSGHKLHETAKGRIIVLDRDDLVECGVLAREALNRHIDRIHIPTNCLDVLAQELYGTLIQQRMHIDDLHTFIKGAYPYATLTRAQLLSVIKYLAGEYADLEDRHVYAKIWYDEETGMLGRKGKLARVLYATNVGTIPDQTDVIVKIGDASIGSISEPFLESLKKGDVFVLGGETYQFAYARGMTAQVRAADGKKPTVPSWFSEMLPLSFDLAMRVQQFRKNMYELFLQKKSKEDILAWITTYLPVDEPAAKSIFEYHKQQHLFARIPHENKLLIEYFSDHKNKYIIFHTLYGRRVNDVLSRAVAYVLGKTGSGDAELGINDNGFYLRYKHTVAGARAFKRLHSNELEALMKNAIHQSEILTRRFRHCAARSLMILRNYKGYKKSVGRQQVSSKILMSLVQRIGKDFPIFLEAQREVLEDKMDIQSAKIILENIEQGKIIIEELGTALPSPFAFSLILQGYADVMRVDERQEFLRKLHQEVIAKISLQGIKQDVLDVASPQEFSYDSHWEKEDFHEQQEHKNTSLLLKEQLFTAARKLKLDANFVYTTQRLIDENRVKVTEEYISQLETLLTGTVHKAISDELVAFLRTKLPDLGWH